MAKFLVAGLMMCFVGSIFAHADHHPFLHDKTLKYKQKGSQNWNLLPKDDKTLIIINSDVFVRRMNENSNDLLITPRNLEIKLRRNNGEEIDVRKCSPIVNAEEPYIAIINDDGSVKGIKVDPHKSDLIVNINLGVVLYSLDIPQLLGKAPRIIERREATEAGKCSKKYTISKLVDNEAIITSFADLAPCGIANNEHRNDRHACMGFDYRKSDQRHLVWLDKTIYNVNTDRRHPMIQKSYHEERIGLNPYVGCDTRVTNHLQLSSKLVSISEASDVPMAHVDKYTRLVDKPVVRRLNSGICNYDSHTKEDDLRQLYSAMSADSQISAIPGDIIERSIMCIEKRQPDHPHQQYHQYHHLRPIFN